VQERQVNYKDVTTRIATAQHEVARTESPQAPPVPSAERTPEAPHAQTSGGIKARWIIGALTLLVVLGGILMWLNMPHGPEKLAKDAEEQYRIGKQYLYGTGVDRDYAEALKWFRKAAARGRADQPRRHVCQWPRSGSG
jgi:hypothetical protein